MSRRVSTSDRRRLWGRQAFLRNIQYTVNAIARLACNANEGNRSSAVNGCLLRLDGVLNNLRRIGLRVLSAEEQVTLTDLVLEMKQEILNVPEVTEVAYRAPRDVMTTGAPKFSITENQATSLFEAGFTTRRMGACLGVSVRTVKRRLRDYGLSRVARLSAVSDPELDDHVQDTIRLNQHMGPNSVRSALYSRGLIVQRRRVRESLNRLDPEGSAIRSSRTVQRRSYSVAGPNSLWHMDGNHKLIKYRMVIHGAIDGFSRMIMFLVASDNNRQDTVFKSFLSATTLHGIPSRLRVDHGGENCLSNDFMELIRGGGRCSVIRGKSVHNQRIERLWVDVWNCVTNVFVDTFEFLTERQLLDVENEQHLWALHFVFLPRVNRQLQAFADQWNNHGLRTAQHMTPRQLFLSGSLSLMNSQLTAFQAPFGALTSDNSSRQHSTGIVLDEIADTENPVDPPNQVSVSSVQFSLSSDQMRFISDNVNPLDDSPGPLGVESYMDVLRLIEHMHVTSA